MRILLIAYYFPPLSSGGSLRPEKWQKWLMHLGHEVWILTHSYQKPTIISNHIIRVYDSAHVRNRRGRHRLHWLFFRLLVETKNRLGIYDSIFSAWKKNVLRQAPAILDRIGPDLIIASYAPVETLEIGLQIAQRMNLPLVCDFRDGLLFEPIEENRMQAHACLRQHYARLEREVSDRAAAILTVSPPITGYFRAAYTAQTAVHTIPNGFDPDDFLAVPDVHFPDPDKLHLVHTGSISRSDSTRDIAPLAKALTRLKAERHDLENRFCLHFIGVLGVGERKLLKNLARQGIVRLHGEMSRSDCLAYQRRADILLLIISANRRGMATTKIFEYIAANRPIMALAAGSTAADIVIRTGTGRVVSPDDTEEIYAMLTSILADPASAIRLDRNPSEIDRYAVPTIVKNLAEVLAGVMEIHHGGLAGAPPRVTIIPATD